MKAKKKQPDANANTVSTLFGKVVLNPEVIEVETNKTNLFSFVDSISATKEYLYTDDTAKEYNPWLINRAFMIHTDTVYHAALMNHWHQLDKKMHHDYFFHTLPKKKRWKKWLKQSEEEKKHQKELEAFAKLLNYNLTRAKQAWALMSETQRNEFLDLAFPDRNNDKKR